MDLQWLIPLGAFLGVIGGGAWKLIDRADKKRERRESAVEELLKAQNARLEAEREREREAAAKRERQLKRELSRVKAHAGKWREQLIAHEIQPDPADWPETEEPNE